MMTPVRAIRDDRGYEIGWYCNGCDRAVNSLWGGLCKSCQAVERRHRELVQAIKSEASPEPQKPSCPAR
jgi:hypothetical protein